MMELRREPDGTVKLYEDRDLVLAWPGPNPGWGTVIDALNMGRETNQFEVDFGEDMPLRLATERIGALLAKPWTGRDSSEDLPLGRIREVNLERCLKWHPPETEQWLGVDWSNAMCGEAGEAANVVKKLRRLDTGAVSRGQEQDREVLVAQLALECADVLLYLDLLAAYYSIDLPTAVVAKFNMTSEKFGFDDRMELEPVYRGM